MFLSHIFKIFFFLKGANEDVEFSKPLTLYWHMVCYHIQMAVTKLWKSPLQPITPRNKATGPFQKQFILKSILLWGVDYLTRESVLNHCKSLLNSHFPGKYFKFGGMKLNFFSCLSYSSFLREFQLDGHFPKIAFVLGTLEIQAG